MAKTPIKKSTWVTLNFFQRPPILSILVVPFIIWTTLPAAKKQKPFHKGVSHQVKRRSIKRGDSAGQEHQP